MAPRDRRRFFSNSTEFPRCIHVQQREWQFGEGLVGMSRCSAVMRTQNLVADHYGKDSFTLRTGAAGRSFVRPV
jgi:hypothetical protein